MLQVYKKHIEALSAFRTTTLDSVFSVAVDRHVSVRGLVIITSSTEKVIFSTRDFLCDNRSVLNAATIVKVHDATGRWSPFDLTLAVASSQVTLALANPTADTPNVNIALYIFHEYVKPVQKRTGQEVMSYIMHFEALPAFANTTFESGYSIAANCRVSVRGHVSISFGAEKVFFKIDDFVCNNTTVLNGATIAKVQDDSEMWSVSDVIVSVAFNKVTVTITNPTGHTFHGNITLWVEESFL